jgi:hypothetical protein
LSAKTCSNPIHLKKLWSTDAFSCRVIPLSYHLPLQILQHTYIKLQDNNSLRANYNLLQLKGALPYPLPESVQPLEWYKQILLYNFNHRQLTLQGGEMTVPEAQERLEALTVTLASCANSPKQRRAIEVKMARCYRLIQRAQQRAHQSLASAATALLEISENAALNEQKATAIVTAAHLIRCASTEQLAVAVPAAIHQTSTDSTAPAPSRFPECSTIVSSLLSLDGPRLPFEERCAIHTALHLINIAERPQIHHSMRRAQACSDGPGIRAMLLRIREIYAATRPPRERKLKLGNRSARPLSLDTCRAAESSR